MARGYTSNKNVLEGDFQSCLQAKIEVPEFQIFFRLSFFITCVAIDVSQAHGMEGIFFRQGPAPKSK
jgi:hypothetical protein